MLYARACDKLPLDKCQHNASAIMETMRSISFDGKIGRVHLDENEDLVPDIITFKSYWLQKSAIVQWISAPSLSIDLICPKKLKS